jgi:O-antigen/teichoic acid export membrane protein
MTSFAQIVLRNSAFGLAAQAAIKVLSFAFNVLVIRQLGATEYGQYAAVGAFGTLFLFIADLDLSPYAAREFARWRNPSRDDMGSNRSGCILGLGRFSTGSPL